MTAGASNGLGIKTHPKKQQRLPTAGLSVYRNVPWMEQHPMQEEGGQRTDWVRSRLPVHHSCHRHPELAEAHTVTFSSSIKPFTDYPLESREGELDRCIPSGWGERRGPGLPPGCRGSQTKG